MDWVWKPKERREVTPSELQNQKTDANPVLNETAGVSSVKKVISEA